MLQAAKSWTDNRNNMNNTRHNAYNSLLSAENVGFASLNGLAWSSHSFAGTPGHLSVIARRIAQIGVRQLLKKGCETLI
jgi:hypothetical protein